MTATQSLAKTHPARSEKSSAVHRLLVEVVHVPFLNLAFRTVPLSAEPWLLCAAMASVVL